MEEVKRAALYSEKGGHFLCCILSDLSTVCYSTRKSLKVDNWKSSPLIRESHTVSLWHWADLFNSAPEIEVWGCSDLPSYQHLSILLTTLASLCFLTHCSWIDGCRVSQVYSSAWGRLVEKGSSDIKRIARTHTFARPHQIDDHQRKDGPWDTTIHFPGLQVNGRICGCTELSNYSNQLL